MLDLVKRACYERVRSTCGEEFDFYICRACRAVDPERNSRGFTNTEHVDGCPFVPLFEIALSIVS